MSKLKWLFVFVLMLLGSVFFIFKRTSSVASSSKQLPLIAKVGSFELTNQEGQSFGSKELHGDLWVVNFIFTRCQGSCPVLTKKYLYLQQQLKDLKQLKYVSITMDPKFDTAVILKKFGSRYQADFKRWSFLTGEQDHIIQIARNLFKIPADKNPELHSTRLVLVDRDANIRGYYEGLDDQSIQTLIDHIRLLTRLDKSVS